MDDGKRKQQVINEAKTLRYSLTKNDRNFIRAYLGFQKIVQIPERVSKKKSDACLFVKRALWAKKKEIKTKEQVHL